MVYVLMYQDDYDEGNYPIAVLDENGKVKVQKLWDNHQFGEIKRGYLNIIETSKSQLERQIATDVYNKFIDSDPDYDSVKENRLSYGLKYGKLELIPFNIMGDKITNSIFKNGYTTQIDKTLL